MSTPNPDEDALRLEDIRRRLSGPNWTPAAGETIADFLLRMYDQEHAKVEYLREQYGLLLRVHQRVNMDTPEDRDLHSQVVTTFREALHRV